MEPHGRGMELGVGVAGTRLSPGIIIRIQEHRSAEWYLRLYSWRCSSSKKEMHENFTIICRGRSSSLITANRWFMILIA